MERIRIVEGIRIREVISDWVRRACWLIGGAMVCWLLVLWFYIPWLQKVENPVRVTQAQIVEANGMVWRLWSDGRTEVAKFEGDDDQWTVRWEMVNQ
jgi:hypothetical protein